MAKGYAAANCRVDNGLREPTVASLGYFRHHQYWACRELSVCRHRAFANGRHIFPFLVWAPTEALLIFIFMFREVGFGSIFGFGILLLGIPVTSYFGKIFADVRIQCAVKTDERNKIVREVVDGIRVVKGNAFEEAFFERIKRIRCEEIGKVHRRARMLALNEGIFTIMPCLVLLSTFFVASLLGEHVTPRKIFVMLSLANIIQLNLTKFFTFSIQNAAEGLITFKRLKDYLILTHSEKAQKGHACESKPAQQRQH